MQNRLAAIMATDMVGYSRLMEIDELGVLTRQKAHRKELIDPKIASNRGVIIKTTGDGMLVTFSSIKDAVRCAIDVQSEMNRRETDEPEEQRISYRIGIRGC